MDFVKLELKQLSLIAESSEWEITTVNRELNRLKQVKKFKSPLLVKKFAQERIPTA